jgi:hypothetical protein
MKKEFIGVGLFLLFFLPVVSASTILEIQTAPLKDVWITALDYKGEAIKVPEMHTVDNCGRMKIDYNISELSFKLMIRVKEGDSVFFYKTFEETFYKDTIINLTALPEDYELNLPEDCYLISSDMNGSEDDSLNGVESLENSEDDEAIESEEEDIVKEDKLDTSSSITGFSFSKEDVLNKNNLIYLVVLILIIVIIYLLVRNRNKDHLIREYHVSNKIPIKKNSKKIEKLKKKIEKYEKEIIRLRQEDLNPHSKERFSSRNIKDKDVLGSEKDDRVHVSDLEKRG